MRKRLFLSLSDSLQTIHSIEKHAVQFQDRGDIKEYYRKIGRKKWEQSLVDIPLNFTEFKRAEKLRVVMKMLSGQLRELWRELWNQQR